MDHHLSRHTHVNHRHAIARQVAHSHGDLPDLSLPSPVTLADPSRILIRDSSDSDATASCTSQSQPGCELPEGATNNTGAIIGVSVAIPVALALIVLIILHRRATKRQAAEDARDAQADLDFGIDPKYKNVNAPKGRGRKGERVNPEMMSSDESFEKSLRKGHHMGVSMDLGNPYILPGEMHSSRDSLHSLTRSITDRQDPYRIVGQTPSVRGFGGGDAGSIRSGSDKALLANPQPNPMSRSQSPLVRTSQTNTPSGEHHNELPGSEPPAAAAVAMPTFDFTDHSTTDNVRPQSDESHRLSDPNKTLPPTPVLGEGAAHDGSAHAATNNAGPVDPYEFKEVVVPPSPTIEAHADAANEHENGLNPDKIHDEKSFPFPPPPEPESNTNRMTLGLGLNIPGGNRLSVLRPLPPDDPNDSAETRANRIRSFYKEYFADDSAHVHDAGGAGYYEDYGDEYLQDGAVFDPDTGRFIVAHAPYADPITRRAMTPPPRGPPQKFRGGPGRPGHHSQGSSPGAGPGPRGRAMSNVSYSRNGNGPRGRGPVKRLPPPAALRNLPTPHLLQENAFNITMDFAPPKTFKERAAGRPDSPFMDEKPYSPPSVATASPLVSSFTELSAVPSPHLLRKSGTFTGLDFAPPPKIRDREGPGSDAGSIRSGRSNFSAVSARQQQNIRAGAYRLSRVPKELVGTKSDLMDSLKPQWKLGT